MVLLSAPGPEPVFVRGADTGAAAFRPLPLDALAGLRVFHGAERLPGAADPLLRRGGGPADGAQPSGFPGRLGPSEDSVHLAAALDRHGAAGDGAQPGRPAGDGVARLAATGGPPVQRVHGGAAGAATGRLAPATGSVAQTDGAGSGPP